MRVEKPVAALLRASGAYLHRIVHIHLTVQSQNICCPELNRVSMRVLEIHASAIEERRAWSSLRSLQTFWPVADSALGKLGVAMARVAAGEPLAVQPNRDLL